MIVDIVTKEDLQEFRMQLLNDIKELLTREKEEKRELEVIEGYKTSHVRKILGCSVNKLVSLRISRKLRIKKIGGTIYYNKEDIKRLLEEGF
ncbi:helix-turn-helix domain-containing protein [Longitalea luteola]|uniref:helix-turn-helix domain-containing protein n=1 Tax=Longitalea luteola TaxID=2812563 RepID=UPI001A96477B|nr:helix-turn-helix domain-containing protein [Longitalea luteola]